jgi:hypothetical protein
MIILKNSLNIVKKGCVLACKGMEEFSAIENDMLMTMRSSLKKVKMRMISKT